MPIDNITCYLNCHLLKIIMLPLKRALVASTPQSSYGSIPDADINWGIVQAGVINCIMNNNNSKHTCWFLHWVFLEQQETPSFSCSATIIFLLWTRKYLYLAGCYSVTEIPSERSLRVLVTWADRVLKKSSNALSRVALAVGRQLEWFTGQI
jgi:hypothetical protein